MSARITTFSVLFAFPAAAALGAYFVFAQHEAPPWLRYAAGAAAGFLLFRHGRKCFGDFRKREAQRAPLAPRRPHRFLAELSAHYLVTLLGTSVAWWVTFRLIVMHPLAVSREALPYVACGVPLL